MAKFKHVIEQYVRNYVSPIITRVGNVENKVTEMNNHQSEMNIEVINFKNELDLLYLS